MTRGGVPGSIPGIPQQEKVAEVRPLKSPTSRRCFVRIPPEL